MSETPEPEPHGLASNFNFWLTLRPSPGGPSSGSEKLSDGGFQECTGLEIEMDVQEHLEGGRNDGVVRLVGRGKYTNLVLRRGMFLSSGGRVNSELWAWMQGVLGGQRPVARYDGVVEVFDPSARQVQATWRFSRGLPVRVKGPDLNAKTGDVAIEELHIAHEGLALELGQ